MTAFSPVKGISDGFSLKNIKLNEKSAIMFYNIDSSSNVACT